MREIIRILIYIINLTKLELITRITKRINYERCIIEDK